VWAFSIKKYQRWLPAPFGGIAAEPADDEVDVAAAPRLVFARMKPDRLRRPIIVRADIGEAAVRLLCTRASLVDVDDPPFFHPPLKCLFVFGMEVLDPDRIPHQGQGKEYVIPLHFVTDIRNGPAGAALVGDHAPQRSAILPNDFRPGNRMSLRSIQSLLADVTEPAPAAAGR
jgi:hypothetical protein